MFFFLLTSCLRQHNVDSLSVWAGGIADSVSKWVFRHSLTPERLREIVRKKDDQDDGSDEKAGEEGKEQEEKSQEDASRTAGQY